MTLEANGHAWKSAKVQDLADYITVGFVGSMSDLFVEDGVPLLRGQNIEPYRLDLTNLKFISAETHRRWRKSALRPRDVVIVRVGYPGTACVIPDGLGDLNAASLVIVRPNPDLLDSTFLCYVLNSPWGKARVQARLVGAAQQVFNTHTAAALEIPAPPLFEQRRIAGILSAYDELIQNSQRRIRILETMARALYREWFVHFRFPGLEGIPKVASPLGDIPQGWEVKEMREIAHVIDCLHSKKPTESRDGPGIFLQLNNIGEAGKLDLRETFRISAEDYALWTSRIELQAGDCVVTNVGRVGAVGQMPEGAKAAPGRNMTAIRPRAGLITPTYLVEYLLSSHMTSEVAKKKDLGTIMDSLNVKGIVRLHVPCPPMDVMLRFEGVARPIRQRVETLVEQTQNLRRTRDLLLPRLLSGQLSLEGAES